MEKAISAAEANRRFSQLLREVRESNRYIVTSHGKPVARISLPTKTSAPQKSREVFFRRLEAEPIRKIGRWTREDLYERD